MAEVVGRLGKGISLPTVPPLFAPIWQVVVLPHVRSSQERDSVGQSDLCPLQQGAL